MFLEEGKEEEGRRVWFRQFGNMSRDSGRTGKVTKEKKDKGLVREQFSQFSEDLARICPR